MFPTSIVEKHFNGEQIKAIVELLYKYQRSGIGWDDWIIKNWPENIREKWIEVLHDCRMQGFINPRAIGDKIVWHQMLGQLLFLNHVDQCTACPVLADECSGGVDARGDFKPCWKDKEV